MYSLSVCDKWGPHTVFHGVYLTHDSSFLCVLKFNPWGGLCSIMWQDITQMLEDQVQIFSYNLSVKED